MRHQFIVIAVCCLSSVFLQACSSDDSDNPWETPVTLKASATVTASKVNSNNNGDLVIVWEEQEQETTPRIDQDLTDLHKTAGYSGHETHTHVDIYQRTNLLSRSYDSTADAWQSEVVLQTGLYTKVKIGEQYVDSDGVTQLRITENVSAAFSTHAAVATNTNGDAIAAWIQPDESAVTAGDAASTYGINVKHYTASSDSWSSAESVTVSEALVLTDLNLSLADDGTAQLFWLARDMNPDLTLVPKEKNTIKLYASAYDGIGVWATETKLTEGSAAKSVQVKMFSENSGVVVWTQLNNGTSVYQGTGTDPCIADATLCESSQLNLYGRWFDDTGWRDTSLLISDARGEVGEFTLASNNSANKVWLAWRQAKIDFDTNDKMIYPKVISDKSQIWVSQFSATDHTWTASVELQADDATTTKDESTQNTTQLDLAIDDQGNVMTVWVQEVVYTFPSDAEFIGKWKNNARRSIWANTFTNSNSTWAGAKLLDSDDRFSNEKPKVVATSTNKFTAVWLQLSSTSQTYGHVLYSVDYDVSANLAGVKYKVDSTADLIGDIYLVKNKTNQLQAVWTGDATGIKSNVKP